MEESRGIQVVLARGTVHILEYSRHRFHGKPVRIFEGAIVREIVNTLEAQTLASSNNHQEWERRFRNPRNKTAMSLPSRIRQLTTRLSGENRGRPRKPAQVLARKQTENRIPQMRYEGLHHDLGSNIH